MSNPPAPVELSRFKVRDRRELPAGVEPVRHGWGADLSQTIEFGRFTVIRHRRAPLADARLIELRARTFDTLMVLIDARGTDLEDELRPRNFFFRGRIPREGPPV